MKINRLITKVLILYFLLLATQAPVLAQGDSWGFSHIPSRVVIKKTGINLPVKSAPIEENTWNVYLDAASFGEGSAVPGVGGNTILFSHDIPRLFYSLHSLEMGDVVTLTTDTDILNYSVKEIHTVSPDDVHYLNQKYKDQLTLFTCTGDAYSKRLVIVAQLDTLLVEN